MERSAIWRLGITERPPAWLRQQLDGVLDRLEIELPPRASRSLREERLEAIRRWLFAAVPANPQQDAFLRYLRGLAPRVWAPNPSGLFWQALKTLAPLAGSEWWTRLEGESQAGRDRPFLWYHDNQPFRKQQHPRASLRRWTGRGRHRPIQLDVSPRPWRGEGLPKLSPRLPFRSRTTTAPLAALNLCQRK